MCSIVLQSGDLCDMFKHVRLLVQSCIITSRSGPTLDIIITVSVGSYIAFYIVIKGAVLA